MKFKLSIITFLCLITLVGCDKNSENSQNFDTSKSENQNLTESNTIQAKKNEIQNKKFELTLLNGKKVALQQNGDNFDINYEGDTEKKATLFVFFATWCPPCKAEIPHLNNLSEKFKEDLNIIAILLENKSDAEILEFAKTYNIKYDISVGDANYILEKAVGGVDGLPSSIMYNVKGEYVIGYKGLVPEEMLESDILKAIK
ncbi:TlpA family protein disulfide reductase [Campylobacter sp. faydin G-140]|uniref:TlpA family protein disulfide reductase n=1 Tax=Campylobacter anatolicus TaxID=2829105 RepID=UPI001B977055|nr:TlpA disulfide reductase family protein [Campylobacter anatolicus]MBR8462213.1 TlpA family protein disulfide reductase [Campylobacter anatolicus]MBR8466418.1 TlpA family protein disulfide reductase [Campylobacter anatolicus]